MVEPDGIGRIDGPFTIGGESLLEIEDGTRMTLSQYTIGPVSIIAQSYLSCMVSLRPLNVQQQLAPRRQ
jgi:hypothetical protein